MENETFEFTSTCGVTFIEEEGGKIRCGRCNKLFDRIISHLQSEHGKECRKNIDIQLIKENPNKVKQKRKKRKYNEKAKQKDEKKFKEDH